MKDNEVFQAIVGSRIGSYWVGRGLLGTQSEGTPSTVSFDYKKIYDREKSHNDFLGFYHTHPHCPGVPSSTDYASMGAWTVCFGRMLLCMIEGTDGLQAHWFFDDESMHETLWVVKIGRYFIGKVPAKK